MLSTDVASTLGGRFMVKELYPYSFREFLVASGLALSQGLPKSTAEKARVAAAFHPFLNYGGFPEILDVSIKLDYLNNVYKTIFLGDIVRRKRIRDPEGVAVLLKKILSNTKPDRIFSYYESMQIRFSSLRPRKEFHPLYRKPCRLPGREMHLRYLLPRRFFEAGCG